MKFAELKLGQTASLSKTITDDLVRQFAELSEDRNPVHLDSAYAEKTFFKQRIAHGMIGVSLVSAVLGNQLPGEGSIYLSSEVRFKLPVYIGETITAQVTVRELKDDKRIVYLDCLVLKVDGSVAVEGAATIKLFS
jgi:3-hydroxybutyryl-CoA dehydratase